MWSSTIGVVVAGERRRPHRRARRRPGEQRVERPGPSSASSGICRSQSPTMSNRTIALDLVERRRALLAAAARTRRTAGCRACRPPRTARSPRASSASKSARWTSGPLRRRGAGRAPARARPPPPRRRRWRRRSPGSRSWCRGGRRRRRPRPRCPGSSPTTFSVRALDSTWPTPGLLQAARRSDSPPGARSPATRTGAGPAPPAPRRSPKRRSLVEGVPVRGAGRRPSSPQPSPPPRPGAPAGTALASFTRARGYPQG